MVNNDKRYNELTGKEWLQYSFSIWRDLRKSAEEIKLKHPAMFPEQLASRVIDIYTKKTNTILDPFMGAGSTVLASYKKGRKGIGIELSKEYISIAKSRLKETKKKLKDIATIEPAIFQDDSRNMMKHLKKESVDLCLTSPPYWDILLRNRTADRQDIRKYSDSDVDLGNINDYVRFLNELKKVFSSVYEVLKPNGHCVIVLMDIRKKDKFYPFHSDMAKIMEELGFVYEDLIIWDRQHEYNNMKPLGYPYVFRVNKVHEYILIFRKRVELNG
ncbi:MAG: site-specific DNA-methyltransferase [Elusimicrobia bacterium]|nr:site-specific DNA-methyltransferase [Candidatus Liberimonas magnetica]